MVEADGTIITCCGILWNWVGGPWQWQQLPPAQQHFQVWWQQLQIPQSLLSMAPLSSRWWQSPCTKMLYNNNNPTPNQTILQQWDDFYDQFYQFANLFNAETPRTHSNTNTAPMLGITNADNNDVLRPIKTYQSLTCSQCRMTLTARTLHLLNWPVAFPHVSSMTTTKYWTMMPIDPNTQQEPHHNCVWTMPHPPHWSL